MAAGWHATRSRRRPAGGRLSVGVGVRAFVKSLDAELDALVTDRGRRPGDDLAYVARAFAAEATAGELAAEFAGVVVVGELLGDVPCGGGELLVRVRAGVGAAPVVVERGGKLLEGSVEQLPGDDWEAWAVALELPWRSPLGIDAVRADWPPGFAERSGLGVGGIGETDKPRREASARVERGLETLACERVAVGGERCRRLVVSGGAVAGRRERPSGGRCEGGGGEGGGQEVDGCSSARTCGLRARSA